MAPAPVLLPRPLAEEVLGRYADVLRVGRLLLNGREVSWDTSASNDAQLRGFCETFVAALRRLPQLAGADDSDLCQAAHWFCKSVSINYALSELLMLLQGRLGEHLGAVCSVRTCGPDGGVLVDYHVDVTEGQAMRVRVSWRGKGNIICCNPRTAQKTVKGTLSYVETEFPIPPEPGFKPVYSVQMKLKGSRSAQLFAKVVRSLSGGRMGVNPSVREEVSPGAPLRAESGSSRGGCRAGSSTPEGTCVSSTMSSATSSTAGGASTRAEASDDEGGVEEDFLFPVPLSFEVKTVRTHLLGCAAACDPPRGGLIRL